MTKLALVTVIHDPEGRNIRLFSKLQKEIQSIYSECFITVSEASSKELVKVLEGNGFNVKTIPKKGAANARREAVKFSLTGSSEYYHYCDFDRLLTWGNTHLLELKGLVKEIPHHDYLILGRTERAMKTHPEEWIETEKITNRISSMELGKEVDITAGSCSFSRECAEQINLHSSAKMTDAEWAMIAKRIAKKQVGYRAVDGLEYHEETNGIFREISESEKWLGRLRLSLIISETAIKTGL